MDDIVGRSWVVTGLPDESVADRPPVLRFEDDGQIYGFSGVNRLRGTWSAHDAVLRFGPIVTTLLAGSPRRIATEQAVLHLLRDQLTVTIIADDEVLLTAPDGSTARLAPAPPELDLI